VFAGGGFEDRVDEVPQFVRVPERGFESPQRDLGVDARKVGGRRRHGQRQVVRRETDVGGDEKF